MSIPTEAYWILFYFLDDLSELVLRACLSDFLCQVIAKGIIHQVHVVIDCMLEDLISDLLVVLIYLLLQEPTSSLVSGQDSRIL
jgi:hypothetical protein